MDKLCYINYNSIKFPKKHYSYIERGQHLSIMTEHEDRKWEIL